MTIFAILLVEVWRMTNTSKPVQWAGAANVLSKIASVEIRTIRTFWNLTWLKSTHKNHHKIASVEIRRIWAFCKLSCLKNTHESHYSGRDQISMVKKYTRKTLQRPVPPAPKVLMQYPNWLHTFSYEVVDFIIVASFYFTRNTRLFIRKTGPFG